MRKYIIKRILISIVILFLVAFVIYALMRCLPTSYVEAMARQKSMQPGSKSFEEWMEQLTRMYNLDVGIVPGFFKWLGQMLTFNFGDSWLWTKPVTEVFNNCVWISFFMGLIAFVLEIIIAIPLGVIAATKQYSKTDYVISVLALAGISLPTFFFASLLKLFFSVWLGWFDLYGLTGRNHEQLSASRSSWTWDIIWFCPSSPWWLSVSVPSCVTPAPTCWRCSTLTSSARPGPRVCPSARSSITMRSATP